MIVLATFFENVNGLTLTRKSGCLESLSNVRGVGGGGSVLDVFSDGRAWPLENLTFHGLRDRLILKD
jgi:hypothetical protein